jgi:small-conductance mechanosensitive channel
MELTRYGLADKWPRLRELSEEVASLEQRRAEAESGVIGTRNAIPAAKDKDTQAAAKALRDGKAMPDAKHEAKAQAAFEDAQRTLAAYTKALESARVDLATFTAKHRAELRADILRALRERAQRLAEHTREAAQLYGTLEDSRHDLRNLAPPPPAPDENAPAQPVSTTLLGHWTLSSTAGAPARGDVEEILGYLASLEAQFVEPGAPSNAA